MKCQNQFFFSVKSLNFIEGNMKFIKTIKANSQIHQVV